MGALQSRAGEDGGRASFSGCFVSGVVVGAVAIASAAWLVAVRGRGGSTRERLLRGRREDGRRKASWDSEMRMKSNELCMLLLSVVRHVLLYHHDWVNETFLQLDVGVSIYRAGSFLEFETEAQG